MGTKSEPGAFDCYGKAAEDEPIFTLRANDPLASMIVHMWADAYRTAGNVDPAKLSEARECANSMIRWRKANVPDNVPEVSS